MRLKPFTDAPAATGGAPSTNPRSADDKREHARQWLLRELENSYFFPREWLLERVVPHDDEDLFGFSLNTTQGDAFFIASIEPGDATEAERRLRQALRDSSFARLGVSTDGAIEGTRVLRRRSNSPECDYVSEIESFAPPSSHGLLGPYKAAGGGKAAEGRPLEPISEALENVFFEAHGHIRDIDGLHADEALDELCKVLYAKLFDEDTTPAGAAYAMQRGATCTVEEFAASVRRLYRDANEYDARVFSLKIPGHDRSRGVFNSPIRLSSPALAKVAETIESHWLGQSSIDVKGRAFQRVLGPTLRAGMGQYFTPLEVIQFIVSVMQPAVTDLILDPFSGSGHFLTQSLDVVRSRSSATDDKMLHEFAFNKLHGIEKSDRMVRVAMTDMRLHGDGHGNVRCTDALLDFQNYPDIRPESFDIVMTNPPFGSLLGPEAVGRLGGFDLGRGRRNVPLEILGLERCIQFLRPGGRLGIVLPDGVLANRGTDFVRRWLADHVKVRAIVSLPVETFSPFGTNIKTCVLFARKWKRGEAKAIDYDVSMISVNNIGYDASGRRRPGSEMAAAAEAVNGFIASEGW